VSEPEEPHHVLLVCSSGGHLTQLYQLEAWWRRFDRTWVTFEKADATSLLEGERVVWAYHPTTRNLWNLLRNTALAWRTIARYRPRLIVSTGAAVAFPFFLIGKLLGARNVYVEVFDRIDSATMTGRLCYPLSDRFVLQWEDQKAMYPKGEVVGPLL
jgi:UDP-N-acetylglucosamine:LPS N-acetylglucosamine transferase